MGTDEAFARRMEALRLLMTALDMLDKDADNFTCAYISTAIDRLEISMRAGNLRSILNRGTYKD